MNLKRALLTIAAITWLYIMPNQAQAYKPVKGRTLQTYAGLKKNTDNPAKAWAFFKTGLKYASDKPGEFVNHKGEKRGVGDDYMQDPIDTYLRGGGDCEDYAALAHDWLASHGYNTKIIAYFSNDKKTGHAVCAIKEEKNQTWSYLGCDAYKRGYKSIEELVSKNEPDWSVFQELTLDQTCATGDRIIKSVYRE